MTQGDAYIGGIVAVVHVLVVLTALGWAALAGFPRPARTVASATALLLLLVVTEGLRILVAWAASTGYWVVTAVAAVLLGPVVAGLLWVWAGEAPRVDLLLVAWVCGIGVENPWAFMYAMRNVGPWHNFVLLIWATRKTITEPVVLAGGRGDEGEVLLGLGFRGVPPGDAQARMEALIARYPLRVRGGGN